MNAGNDVFPVETTVYADAPVEYFDFPSNVFESDGQYTIKAWAEDDDGTRISPQASIVISSREGQSVTDDAEYLGYTSPALPGAWGSVAGEGGLTQVH